MSWRVALRARAGEFELDVALTGADGPLAVVGPNGAGKTTLLRCIAGTHPVLRAEIEVGDVVLAGPGVQLPPERRRVGYVPQGAGLFPHLDVLDNICFAGAVGPERQSRDGRRAQARTLLTQIGATALADRRVDGLSGGERQRVALARALFIEPRLLLLDEPLAALDVGARRSVRRALAARLVGRPALVVTHDVRDVHGLDAEVVVLEAGRIVQRGSLGDLRADPRTPFVEEFVGVPL